MTLRGAIKMVNWTPVGLFADGVTFTKINDFAIDANGTQWFYIGDYPFTATAGTVPSKPLYQAIIVNDHNRLLNRDEVGAHDAGSISRGTSNVSDDLTAIEDELSATSSLSAANSSSISALSSSVSSIEIRVATAESEIDALELSQSSGVIGYATKALLEADLAPADKSIAYVTNDSTSTNNGTYRKSGATGVGSWIQSSTDLASQAYQKSVANESSIVSITDSVNFESTSSAGDNLVYSVVDQFGKVLFGVDNVGKFKNSDIQALNGDESQTMNIIPVYGQSNAIGAIDFSQQWRIPMPWGVYPPSYSGELDGNHYITTSRTGVNTWTLNNNRLSFNAFNGATFGSAGEGIFHGMLDSIASRNPNHKMVTFTHGVGSLTIEALDKPTSTEITAGSASGITIPTTSAEKMMQDAGHDMSYINEYVYNTCATPYYQGMWLIARAAKIAKESHTPFAKVSAMAWLQGEANQTTADYKTKLIALYDTYNADVKLITGQRDDIVMITESINYANALEINGQAGYDTWVASGYTDTSAYIGDPFRINNQSLLDNVKLKLQQNSRNTTPSRNIIVAAARYPETARIHIYPHAARAHGEKFGKAYESAVIRKKEFKPMYPEKCWHDGQYVYITFNTPVLPIQFKVPPVSTTTEQNVARPYGFTYAEQAGNAIVTIDKAKVLIVGDSTVRIEAPVVPQAGHEIRYVIDTMYGSLCDSDDTTAVFNSRIGTANRLENYCLPFTIKLQGA
ncbi:MAG: hypothetical protein COY92_07220 [Shewanella sp. CG_4_10_14_0_8_um_filter_42_13]|nr:MAG: hypothetical protein COY92_07220 [Shewanella sp. CG_4_10_14_0_8_um_filter_42_13]